MDLAEKYREQIFNTDKIKIGIKWRGNTTFDKDRVIPAELFNQLTEVENTQFYSFQTFEGAEDVSKINNVIDIGKDLIDFSQTAAALRNLDLVICNDTSLAHLAGAMKVPCWIMLPYDVDWRWGVDLSKCDWYESVKLFRQKNIGDWQSVFDQILEEMKP
jgi:ADP-heptose:LPS heptosyltransferase